VPWIALDTEATGLEPGSRLVELAAVRFDLDGRVIDRFEALVDPGLPLPPDVTALTGLRDHDLRGRPPAESALRRFRAWLGDDRLLAAHNAGFDVSLLGWECDGARLPMPRWRVVDTVDCAKALGTPGGLSLEAQRAAYGWDQAGHRAGGVVTVHGAQNLVPGQRRFHRDLRGLAVPDLADHHDVRVLTQDRAQGIGKAQPDLLSDRHLVDASDLELHRVLHRDDVVFRIVEFVEHRIQRGGLSGTRRPRHQNQPMRRVHRRLEPAIGVLLQPEVDDGILQQAADEKLHREIVDALAALAVDAAGRLEPRIDESVADHTRQRQPPVRQRRGGGVLANRVAQLVVDRIAQGRGVGWTQRF